MTATAPSVGVGRVSTRPARPLWVFGYGSLMWQPGFPYLEARRARIDGFRRAFCVLSIHYRGSPRRPGLVLGLQRGGSCEGMAFRVADDAAAAVRAYLHARELIYGVYREALVPARLLDGDGGRVDVLTYVAEACHPSYAGGMPLAKQATVMRGARGLAGSNLAYLAATVSKLRSLDIRQPDLERLAVLAGLTGAAALGATEPVLRARSQGFSARPCLIAPARNERRHAFSFRRALTP